MFKTILLIFDFKIIFWNDMIHFVWPKSNEGSQGEIRRRVVEKMKSSGYLFLWLIMETFKVVKIELWKFNYSIDCLKLQQVHSTGSSRDFLLVCGMGIVRIAFYKLLKNMWYSLTEVIPFLFCRPLCSCLYMCVLKICYLIQRSIFFFLESHCSAR